MKKLLLLSFFAFISFASASTDWKVIAETTSCDEKIQVLGKEGEKYVLAVKGEEKIKLFTEDGSSFSLDSMKNTQFTAKTAEATYRFIQPSYVEANPPKIDVSHHGLRKRCKMELAR